MSDDTTQQTPEQDDPDGYTAEQILGKDWTLDGLISMVTGGASDSAEGTIGLTLNVGGLAVSGLVISAAHFAERVRTDYAEHDTLVQFARFFDAEVNKAKEILERRDAAELPMPARQFVHMKDARIYAGGTEINVPLWRGRLSEVSGWALGSWNPPRGA